MHFDRPMRWTIQRIEQRSGVCPAMLRNLQACRLHTPALRTDVHCSADQQSTHHPWTQESDQLPLQRHHSLLRNLTPITKYLALDLSNFLDLPRRADMRTCARSRLELPDARCRETHFRVPAGTRVRACACAEDCGFDLSEVFGRGEEDEFVAGGHGGRLLRRRLWC